MEPSEQNKLMSKNRIRGIETWNRLTAIRGEGQSGDWLKGGGVSQRTYIHDPWTWTTVLSLPKGWRGSVEGDKGGKV